MKYNYILITALLVTLLVGCQKESIQPVNMKLDLDNARGGSGGGTGTTFTLGQSYGGGYIFYIDATGQHGLIVSPDVLLGAFPWAKGTTALATGATNPDGNSNTKRIIQVYGNVAKFSVPYAAFAAKQYRGGGFSDWYLPSIEELSTLMSKINDYNFNIQDFGNGYWSSTECTTGCAYTKGGITTDVFALRIVRPIRKF